MCWSPCYRLAGGSAHFFPTPLPLNHASSLRTATVGLLVSQKPENATIRIPGEERGPVARAGAKATRKATVSDERLGFYKKANRWEGGEEGRDPRVGGAVHVPNADTRLWGHRGPPGLNNQE